MSVEETETHDSEMSAVIHVPKYGFIVTEEKVSIYRGLEPDEDYEPQQVKQKMEEMEYWVNEITGGRLKDNRWEMRPVNVIKPSQEQQF